MSDLSDKFAAFEDQVATEHTAIMGSLADIQTALDFINTQLDTININAAANTKAILSALGQTGACFPCPTPSVVVPPIGTVPIEVSNDLCKRAQAMIATIHNILDAFDTMQSFNVVGTFNVVNDAISEIISAIAAGDTVPLPSFPEVVGIVGNYISYAGERLFSGVGLIDQFAPLETSLVTALVGATDADSAHSLYNGIIDGADLSLVGRFLIEAVPYNALWSYFFDPTSDPDLSAYDGSACFGTECYLFNSVTTLLGGSSSVAAVEWPSIFVPVDNVAGFTSDHLTWATVDMIGWKIKPDNLITIRTFNGDTGTGINANTVYTIPSSTTFVALHRGDTTPFTVQVCPPGVEPS